MWPFTSHPPLVPQNAAGQLLDFFLGRDQSSSYLFLDVRVKPHCLAKNIYIYLGRQNPTETV